MLAHQAFSMFLSLPLMFHLEQFFATTLFHFSIYEQFLIKFLEWVRLQSFVQCGRTLQDKETLLWSPGHNLFLPLAASRLVSNCVLLLYYMRFYIFHVTSHFYETWSWTKSTKYWLKENNNTDLCFKKIIL